MALEIQIHVMGQAQKVARINRFLSMLLGIDLPICINHIGGLLVSVLASSVVIHWFEAHSGQTKDYKLVSVVSQLSMQH
jgi:hypothetical protein